VRGIDQLLDAYAQDVRNVAQSEAVALVGIFDAFEQYGATRVCVAVRRHPEIT
jgi:hypothetical protein